MPGEGSVVNRGLDSLLESLAELDHVRERVVGEDVLERGPHRSERENVARERSSDSADIRLVPADGRPDALRDLGGEPVGGRGNPAPDRLPNGEQVRFEPVLRRVPAGTGAERVRLVDDQQGLRTARQHAQRIVEAGLGVDDPDVRQDRLGEDAGDVAVRQLTLERVDVVPLDDPRRLVQRHRRAEIAMPLDDPAVPKCGECLVDCAVVAPVEDEHLRAARDQAGEPDREPVGVGRGQRELPPGKSKAACELLADPKGVLARKHERDPAGGLLRDRASDRLRRVPGHGSRVAEAEVDVLDPVDVPEVRPGCLAGEERKAAGPPHHPVHGHSREQRGVRALGELSGPRMISLKTLELALEQTLRELAGHGAIRSCGHAAH